MPKEKIEKKAETHTELALPAFQVHVSVRKLKMAFSPLNPKTHYHARSISLPSRTHPLTLRVQEQLYRLKSSEATSPSSTASICNNLGGVRDLYGWVDDLLQSPITQRVLAHEKSDKCVNDVLDGSLALLDTCSTTRDVIMHMKECIQDLQSSLRRRRGEFGFASEVGTYMNSRKKLSKVVQKCFADLKRTENKPTLPSSLLEKDQNLVAIVGALREVESFTLSMFETVMSFVSRSKARSKSSSWSLVSKLMHNRGHEATDICESEKVDVALQALTCQNSCKGIEAVVNVQNAKKQLEALELSIQGLEDKLECVFKSLIKTRVSLLNILSN